MKKLFFLNLLALFGYINCVFWFYELFIYLPTVIHNEITTGTEPIFYFAHISYLIIMLKICGIIILSLLILAVVEYLVKKYFFAVTYNNFVPKDFSKVYTWIFTIGLILVLSPLFFIFIQIIIIYL